MNKSVLSSLFLAVIISLPGWAAEEDLKFIKGLLEREYYDLAIEQAEKTAATPGLPAEIKTNLELQRVLIRWEWAKSSFQDPALSSRLDSEANKLFEQFAKNNPKHPGIRELKLEQALFQAQQGKHLAKLIERGIADKKDIKIAERFFQNAVANLESLRKVLQERKTKIERLWVPGEKSTRQERLEREMGYAEQGLLKIDLGLPDIHYEQAKLVEKTNPSKSRQQMEKAAKKFEECALYWQSLAPAAHSIATARHGRCLTALGKREEAIEKFDQVIESKTKPDAGSRSYMQHALRLAYVGKAEALNHLGRYDETVKTVDRFLSKKTVTGWEEGGEQWAESLIQKARALGLTAEEQAKKKNPQWRRTLERATAAGTKVATKGPREMREQAQEMIGKWIEKLGSGTAEQLLIGAEDLLKSKKFAEALRVYRSARMNADPKAKDLTLKIWQRIGLCYINLEQYPEAALVYEQVAKIITEGGDEAENASFRWFIMLQKTYDTSGTLADAEELITALDAYLHRFPAGEHVNQARYSRARAEFDRGNYDEAIANAKKIDKVSQYRPESLLLIGRSYQALYNVKKRNKAPANAVRTQAEKATTTLEQFLSSAKSVVKNAEDKKRASQVWAMAAYSKILLAGVYLSDELDAPDKALKVLDNFEQEHSESKEMFAQLNYLMLLAYVRKERPDKGDEFLSRLTKLDRQNRLTKNAIKILAKAFGELAEKTKDSDAASKLRLRQAQLVGMLGDGKGCSTVRNAAMLAKRQHEAGHLNAAINTLEDTIRKNKDREECKQMVRYDISYRLGKYHIEAESWQTAIKIFEELNKEYPDVADLMEGLALSYEGDSQFSKAQASWENLWRRQKKASPEWFFAKYHIALCLLGKKQYADTQGVIENMKFFYGDDHEAWNSVSQEYPDLKKSIDELLQKAKTLGNEE